MINEKGIDENIVKDKVKYFIENSVKIQYIFLQLRIHDNQI